MAQHATPTPTANAPHNVAAVMLAAFSKPRDPRSPEYKAGTTAYLALRIEGKPMPAPFALGTAAADAFFSGVDEGRMIWTDLQIQAAA